VRAYKFLREAGGGRYEGPFSGFVWPAPAPGAPAPEVRCRGPLEPGRHGVSACRVDDLPYWIHDTLWAIDLAGDAVEAEVLVAASSGRLVERVEAWDAAACRRFGHDCVQRLRTQVADAVGRDGHDQVAAALTEAGAAELPALVPDGQPHLRRLLEYVGDAAEYALAADDGDAAPAPRVAAVAYITAHAARFAATHLSGWRGPADAYLGERLAQAGWFRTWCLG
jgi:hypothetical protein